MGDRQASHQVAGQPIVSDACNALPRVQTQLGSAPSDLLAPTRGRASAASQRHSRRRGKGWGRAEDTHDTKRRHSERQKRSRSKMRIESARETVAKVERTSITRQINRRCGKKWRFGHFSNQIILRVSCDVHKISPCVFFVAGARRRGEQRVRFEKRCRSRCVRSCVLRLPSRSLSVPGATPNSGA